MKTRTRTLGAAVGAAAIAVSLPLSVTAHAEPATVETPLPNLEGDCDPFRAAVPTWKSFIDQPVSQVLTQIPDISTFSAAISGGLNPAVNVAPVLDNGPYVVFAPTDEAFAKLPAGCHLHLDEVARGGVDDVLVAALRRLIAVEVRICS